MHRSPVAVMAAAADHDSRQGGVETALLQAGPPEQLGAHDVVKPLVRDLVYPAGGDPGRGTDVNDLQRLPLLETLGQVDGRDFGDDGGLQ